MDSLEQWGTVSLSSYFISRMISKAVCQARSGQGYHETTGKGLWRVGECDIPPIWLPHPSNVNLESLPTWGPSSRWASFSDCFLEQCIMCLKGRTGYLGIRCPKSGKSSDREILLPESRFSKQLMAESKEGKASCAQKLATLQWPVRSKSSWSYSVRNRKTFTVMFAGRTNYKLKMGVLLGSQEIWTVKMLAMCCKEPNTQSITQNTASRKTLFWKLNYT